MKYFLAILLVAGLCVPAEAGPIRNFLSKLRPNRAASVSTSHTRVVQRTVSQNTAAAAPVRSGCHMVNGRLVCPATR